LEGRQEGVIEALEIRFGELPDELTTAISEVQDIEPLKHLHREAIRCRVSIFPQIAPLREKISFERKSS